jgi:simple sugar transport system substrate-binding protein
MMTQSQSFLARTLTRAAACALALALAGGFAGCKKEDTTAVPGAGASSGGSSDKTLTVGFLYVGTKDDYGYNQAHADGAAAVKAIPGVKVLEVEKVAETKDCQQAMESMINLSDATLVFPTSFGYFNPHVLDVGKKYPKITFLHAGGQWKDGMPANVGSYFAYIDEGEYLCGMVAGKTSKTGKLGYVAAKPITPVLRDINAFELGAKSVNPKATTTVIFTGDWFLPVQEADAVNKLADQGIDVITGHVDSPKVLIQTADKRGIYSCGYHSNGAKLSPEKYLTGAEWNWGPMYVDYVNKFKAGTLKDKMPHSENGSLKTGAVVMSAYGPAVSAETKKVVDEAKAKMMDGKFKIYVGPINDNKGKEVIPAGKEYEDEDGALWGVVNFFVEGVIGSTGG